MELINVTVDWSRIENMLLKHCAGRQKLRR
jgi:hypothetical protein